MRKSILFILLFLLSVSLPYLFWQSTAKESYHVCIIDQTVPDESFREHNSLTWLLNYNQYTTNQNQPYRASDYYGMIPDEHKKKITENPLPSTLSNTDLIYVADTYGIYKEDVPWDEQTNAGQSSRLIEGGMTMEDWKTIEKETEIHGKDLIMEFNSFASPTSEAVRKNITEYLGIEWKGWIGRHFNELSQNQDEVPTWIISRYEDEKGKWSYQGKGIVFIHEFSSKIFVLSEENGDLSDSDILASFTKEGTKRLNLEKSTPYTYWFDILEPTDEADVLAEYNIQLTVSGRKKMKKHQIPATFPAILYQKEKTSDRYYFAGDYVDLSDVPPIYQYKGFAKVKQWMAHIQPHAEDSFFWSTYQPMMQEILADLSIKEEKQKVDPVSQAVTEGIHHPSRVSENKIEVYQNNEWIPLRIKGVNIGMGKPGYFPGEAAINKEEYARWFQQIGDMNANAIRIYTLHPPEFYDALAEYNKRADQPLYVFHGVWIDEEPLEEKKDAFDKDITADFQKEMKKIVDVIHGNADVSKEPGHASGLYTTDISPYVIGWIIGIEWFPMMVDQMKKDYPELGDFEGTITKTKGADPMEYWLAQQMDFLGSYEIDKYESIRPLSFTNWVTTDNIEQPAEPLEQEDLAVIDPNHILPKGQSAATGMFASYHVYPYYPDFLNIEEKYTEYIDHRGGRNNYAGYLKNLNDSHNLPILIAEFGIPASRGKTHENPLGWNQGFISETEQGQIVKHLYEDILAEDLLGGLVFSWQDEWFKRTWNTMDYDNPDRRPYWSNAQTNEQQFGLLSFDRLKVKLNGQNDWTDGKTLYKKKDGDLREMTVDHDERYVYIKTTFEDLTDKFWEEKDYQIHFSVRPDQGVETDDTPLLSDFRVTIKNKKDAEIEVAQDYDVFHFDYVEKLKMVDDPYEGENFHPIRLALNKGLVRPDTGEKFPFESYETGALRFGIGDPEDKGYDSLSDYFYSTDTEILELRIPWMLLNARDPSQKEFIGDLSEDGIEASQTVEGLDITSVVKEKGKTTDAFSSEIAARYTWERWDLPAYEERLKESYLIIQKLFSQIK
ncbi:hypothetical protein [Halobacillus litoralis]|uniref:hypothetical protein n=1 Tax=Halobacillus litoralis TaxID=45668 RepID=UPI001CFCD002|nr:hypothetical protein [Halobacillus litoralis]